MAALFSNLFNKNNDEEQTYKNDSQRKRRYEKNFTMGENQGLLQISPAVIEFIAQKAVLEIKGVRGVRGSFSERISGLRRNGRGVVVHKISDTVLNIDIFLELSFGVNIPKTDLEIRNVVKSEIEAMTDLVVQEIDVHVDAIGSDKTDSAIDSDDIFGKKDKETLKEKKETKTSTSKKTSSTRKTSAKPKTVKKATTKKTATKTNAKKAEK